MVEVIEILTEPDPSKRDDSEYDNLEYVFIDDPVSSLDENHLIELAIDLAGLIAASRYENGNGVKFLITTHNPLFFNVLSKELQGAAPWLLSRNQDGSLELVSKNGAANKSFSYHHHLKMILEQAIADNTVEKYHFNLLRNLYDLSSEEVAEPTEKQKEEVAILLKNLINNYGYWQQEAQDG